MGLTMSQRKGITAQTVARYRRATRRQKAALLDEFVEMHDSTRHHAAWVLRMWARRSSSAATANWSPSWSVSAARHAVAPAATTNAWQRRCAGSGTCSAACAASGW